jgi:hypothetical protein
MRKLVRCGLTILLALLLCTPLYAGKNYNPAEKPYEVAETNKCEGMVNGFEMFLRVQATKVIEDTKNQNPRILELVPKVKLLECISEAQAKVEVKSKIKARLTYIEPKTKKKVVQIQCGEHTTNMLLEKKGAFLNPTPIDKEPKPVTPVPCE